MNITVLRPGGIGDAVFAIPMLQVLREVESESRVHFIGHLEAGNLLKSVGLVDEAHKQSAHSSPDNIYSGAIEIMGRMGLKFDDARKKAALSSLGNPDLMIAFSIDSMAMSYALEEIGVPRYTVQHWQPYGVMHQAEHMVLALRNVGYMKRYEVKPIHLTEQVPHIPYLNVAKTVVLNPGSGLDYKKWPLDNWINLSQKLNSLGSEIIVLEGPMESQLGYKEKFIGCRVLNYNLKETSGLLGLGMPFIGGDSGLTHLAAIAGCPTINLMGPTHPNNWASIGPDVQVVRKCSKESEGAVRVCYDDDCMSNISVNNILDIFIREIRK